jgi:hypothetical protein
MSLISDSLKKAQRMRGDPGGQTPGVGGNGGGRGRGSSGVPAWLIVTGAIALVAVAVAVTAILLQPKSVAPIAASPIPLVVPAKSTAGSNAPESPGAIAVPPVISVAKPTSAPAPLVAAATPETANAQKNPAAKPSAEVVAFIEAIHVTGVRSSGDGSKVLMNDHVYKVNDVVDRMLNVRLIEVKPDGLTFEDSNGVQYSKNF